MALMSLAVVAVICQYGEPPCRARVPSGVVAFWNRIIIPPLMMVGGLGSWQINVLEIMWCCKPPTCKPPIRRAQES
jgi:hypothetical protein